jgi:hypothetical protein
VINIAHVVVTETAAQVTSGHAGNPQQPSHLRIENISTGGSAQTVTLLESASATLGVALAPGDVIEVPLSTEEHLFAVVADDNGAASTRTVVVLQTRVR